MTTTFGTSNLTTGGFESRVNRLLRDTESHRKRPTDVFDVAGFRRQEAAIIALNLTALIGIAAIYGGFHTVVGDLSVPVVIAFAARIAMQVAELSYLLSPLPLPRIAGLIWAHLAVWVHVGFVTLLSVLEVSEDSHFVVLMLIPIVAAAFRFGSVGLTAVVVVLIGVSLVEVWVTEDMRIDLADAEWFEAATVALAYVIVAILVRALVRQLRSEQRRLRFSLNALERTRDQLVTNERLAAVGELASGIAHEIRNPVAMIASSVAMITGGNAQRDGRMLEIIQHESKRLETLTTDFLTYARDHEPDRQITDVGTTLGYLRGLAEAWAGERLVRIDIECPRPISAAFDPYRLQQALLNLLRNAITAATPGTAVLLSAAGGDGVVTFHVANRGEPIPAELTSRIFEPFVTHSRGGTGLGLPIARRIAEAHGGQLELSMNGGGWVCFSLTIPVGVTTP